MTCQPDPCGAARTRSRRAWHDRAWFDRAGLALALPLLLPVVAQAADAASAAADPGHPIVVTASRADLLGVAATASTGSVTQVELDLRPVYRVGQLLEAVPGLVVTVHAGEGKANQYLLRGFNLDHGTDIAHFIDDMPINRPSNTHGQGYADVNFELPQLTDGLDYTKGPYHAAVGDFGAVASTHLKLANVIDNQLAITGGTLGVYNVFGGATLPLGPATRLTGGLTFAHLDGPFDHPDQFRKLAGELRLSHGDARDGWSLTAMAYRGQGNMTIDQPVAAVTTGLIDRYGTLDPTDGSRSARYSLSGHWAYTGSRWTVSASLYAIHATMTLWSDFTHWLDDPVNGDQEAQSESRDTFGGALTAQWHHDLGHLSSQTVFGWQLRLDAADVGRQHTRQRRVLDTCAHEGVDPGYIAGDANGTSYFAAVAGYCQRDRVHLADAAPWIENTTHWTAWLRTTLGLREELYVADDTSLATGFHARGHQTLLQPKASVAVGPVARTELYLSYGRGFHSDDVRGVFGTLPLEGVPAKAGHTPLLAAATGLELGLRSDPAPHLAVQVALFQQDFASELAYDQDQGEDTASAPSRRRGLELSGQYHPARWIELNADLAWSRARYRGDAASLATFNLGGPWIANAPAFIGSAGVLVHRAAWSGGVQWRRLGAYPITDGQALPRDPGYSEVNADVSWRFDARTTLTLSVFNLLNTRANASAYAYTWRLSPTAAVGSGPTFHPLEPRSASLRVAVRL